MPALLKLRRRRHERSDRTEKYWTNGEVDGDIYDLDKETRTAQRQRPGRKDCHLHESCTIAKAWKSNMGATRGATADQIRLLTLAYDQRPMCE